MKRRPWCSKLPFAIPALLCALLVGFSPASWPASAGKTGQAGVSTAAQLASKSKVAGKTRSPQKRHRQVQPAPEIGMAEISDAGTMGLHGLASFYGHGFQGRKTATGELFDVKNFTAASNRFPLGSMVAVSRIDNDRCAIVKINDRMHARHRRRIIDVSRGVADYLGMLNAGVVMVRVAPLKDDPPARRQIDCQSAFDPEPLCVDCERLLLDRGS